MSGLVQVALLIIGMVVLGCMTIGPGPVFMFGAMIVGSLLGLAIWVGIPVLAIVLLAKLALRLLQR